MSAVDAANILAIPGLDVPKGTPGAGQDFQYKFVYDSSKAQSILGIHFRDIITSAKDTIENIKAHGW